MTLIPPAINQTDSQKNLTRAIIGLASVATPSPLTKADPAQSIAAFSAVAGVKGFEKSFTVTSNTTNPELTDFAAELPLSAKLFAATLDRRKSILPLPSTATVTMPAVANPAAITSTATNLEQYLYDAAVAVQATMNGESPSRQVKIQTAIDISTRRTFLSITGTLDSRLDDLISGSDTSTAQG